MKANIKDIFSLSAIDTEYFNDKQEKFELVSCPLNGKHCKTLRLSINKDYQESQLYHRNKIYQKSLDSLKSAYNTTFKLTESTCGNCAELFRSSIIQSMEEIKNEHYKSSVGLLRYKLHRIGFLKLNNALKEA